MTTGGSSGSSSSEGDTIRALCARALAAVPPEGSVAAADLAKIAAWIELVEAWGKKIDLTAARSAAELVDLMVADASVLAGAIAGDRTVVDVGSGAGAPGLPLALLRPDLRLTLVEPMQKRAALLRLAVGQLDVADRVAIAQQRGEQLVLRFDVAISRATLPPAAWLALGAELADEVWVLLAREPDPAHEGWRAAETLAYRWPLTDASRRAVRFVRG